ncbi:MAG: hypothetical protein HY878_03045 [Deltaproteobacteria bacterium]|nr:hypothetical protein [Deltaproteobacteria bacterium]
MPRPLITTPEAAMRLARAIVSDIAIYNKDKIREGIKGDNLFELLKEELKEGLELYQSRVDAELTSKTNFYNRAIVDVLIKRCGDIESEIW